MIQVHQNPAKSHPNPKNQEMLVPVPASIERITGDFRLSLEFDDGFLPVGS
jgi:hypothetical protein